MKTLLTTFVLATVLLTACNAPVEPEPVTEPLDDDKPVETDGSLLSSEQTVNADGSITLTISWEGEAVGTIEKDKPADGYEVVLFDQTEENAYIAVNYTGLGGYILYGGAHSVYQLNLSTKTLVPVYETEAMGFATDVSSDDSTMAIFTGNEIGAIVLSTYSIEEYKKGPYNSVNTVVPAEFFQAGDAVFSPDSTKLAFAATVAPVGMGADTDTGTNLEETAVFIVDLDTGKMEEFKRIDGTVDVSWDSGDEPSLK